MVCVGVIQLLVLSALLCLLQPEPTRGGNGSHLFITPQSPVLEIGTNFTATCVILDTTEVTADDLYWNLSTRTIPKDHYTKVNVSALSVTIPIVGERPEWLFCFSKLVSAHVFLNKGKFEHGIILTKEYRLERPKNLTCVAHQEKALISRTISCAWEPGGLSAADAPTTFELKVRDILNQTYSQRTREHHTSVSLVIFPNHVPLDIWVEAENRLGKIESEHLKKDAGYFVKTNPPSDVKVISESSFPTSLLIDWTHPISEQYLVLAYQIRFCEGRSDSWTDVPRADTAKYIQTFRLQNLQPYTVYDIQVRCKNNIDEDYGYWSDWSANATERTPEDRPSSKPRVWRIISDEERSGRRVQFICKDPVSPRGRILGFNVKTVEQKAKVNISALKWETVSRSEKSYTILNDFHLASKAVKVFVTAFNSVGKSPEAALFIPEKGQDLNPVQELKVWPSDGRLWVEWKPPKSNVVREYVVEWVGGGERDWQREKMSTTRTFIKGHLEKFIRYTVSVYPLYSGWVGKAASVDNFLEQGAPLEAPSVGVKDKPGRNEVELVWKEVPEHRRRGFINYTVYYTNGTLLQNVTLPGNVTSCTLTSLSGDTKYDTWINASTIVGSARGFNHSFTTLKYAQRQIEVIVVGVSLGFLFVVLMAMLLCIYKKDAIKENFWPQIPNPGESTIRDWSPDYPLKAETPKENCVSGISVLGVDECVRKCVFEEEKGGHPLKKDKYLSEEHSSGIGGSSCMSSPRQSVSDSDEGGDAADTTASTVQYSSVVAAASNGYKGQTPTSQPQQAALFARSESTQPLLDSEENPDTSLHFPQPRSCFGSRGGADVTRLEMERQDEALEPLDFFPLEEDDGEPTASGDDPSADWLSAAAPASSYMPQRGGYRPQ